MQTFEQRIIDGAAVDDAKIVRRRNPTTHRLAAAEIVFGLP
jgi:hypothetical protein